MLGRLKTSFSGDGTESKKESSTSIESRYAKISCSGMTDVGVGTTGGRCDGSGEGAPCVIGEGG